MTYVAAEARRQLLDAMAAPIDDLAAVLAALGAAYDGLDERMQDRLEDELFRPAQAAYGHAKRTHAAFAARHGLAGATFAPAPEPAASRGVKPLIEAALDAADRADHAISGLQDSGALIEVGDQELRAGLAEVRTDLTHLRSRARELVRVFGR